jgi:hypothetical protein
MEEVVEHDLGSFRGAETVIENFRLNDLYKLRSSEDLNRRVSAMEWNISKLRKNCNRISSNGGSSKDIYLNTLTDDRPT